MVQALAPAIVLGGSQNALSVARNLARHGIEVVAVNYPYEAVRFSRYARYVSLGDDSSPQIWKRFLLGEESDPLRGSVLLPCADAAISIVIEHHAVLSRKFLLEEPDPLMRRDLLDKFVTYQRAREAGIPTVGYWLVRSREDLERSMAEYRFPLVMKALYPPHADLLKSKAILIRDRRALVETFRTAAMLGVDVVLMEYIPGGDDQACSFHTYLDEHGEPLFQFTNTVSRRFPLMSGEATYCVSDWIPDAAERGLRFFRHCGFRGLGMVQFKRDERDGDLKIIEANARFVASDILLARSGINLALIAYNRITGRPQTAIPDFRRSVVLCRPFMDARAAWSLRKRGELRLSHWLAELRRIDQLPFFEWRDPLPALFVTARCGWRFGARLLRRAMTQVSMVLGAEG
jgi:D-aspartate ligase